MENLKLAARERDLFLAFHNNVVSPEFKSPQCQCNFIEEAFTYVKANNIPFDEVEITCEECSQTHKLPIPKKTHAEGTKEANIY